MKRAALFLLLVCAACHKEGPTPPRAAGLDAVPADTAWMVMSSEPRPVDEIARRFEMVCGQARQATPELMASLPKSTRGLMALMKFLADAFAPGGKLRSTVPERVNLVAYGLGVLPVVRLGLLDPAAARRAIAEAIKDEAPDPPKQGLGAAQWRFAVNESLEVFVAVTEHELVFALIPTDGGSDAIERILRQPDASLRAAWPPKDWPQEARSAALMGFADTQAIARIATGADAGTYGRWFAATHLLAPSPTCAAELPPLAARAPHVWIWADQGADLRMHFVAQLDPEVAREVASWQVSSAFSTFDLSGGFVALTSVAIDSDRLVAALERWGKGIEARPFRCERLAFLNKLIGFTVAGEPTYAKGLRGFLTATRSGALQQGGFSGVIGFEAVDISTVLDEVGRMFQFDPSRLARDGTPIPLELKTGELDHPMVAITATRLVAGAGPDAESDSKKVLAAKPAGPSPFYASTTDISTLAKDPTLAAAESPATQWVLSLGGVMTVSVRPHPAGLEAMFAFSGSPAPPPPAGGL